jgi:peroxiredoxin
MMKPINRSFSLFLALLLCAFSAFAQIEQAPIIEREVKYKDWTYRNAVDSRMINLRDFTRDKKLVLVVYIAPWCHNWKHQAPFTEKLYQKYKKHGFDVIGVSEYGAADEVKTHLAEYKITFPVVIESESRLDRQKTPHYDYRRETGDTRKWGSPWNIFLEPINLTKKGDVLLKKTFLVNGELIEAEAEPFIRQKLGFSAQETPAPKPAAKTVSQTAAKPAADPKTKTADPKKPAEICEPDAKAPVFKKP